MLRSVDPSALATDSERAAVINVRHFRQVLLWPLRLMPLNGSAGTHYRPWQLLREIGEGSPWREVVDEYAGEGGSFHERHYSEFVTFLPYVQRFLYGEGRSLHASGTSGAESPMRVFRRRDIAAVRVAARPGDAPIRLEIVHVDLYFFFDIDVVMLNVEVSADDLPLSQAQELLYRFGRAYPAGWDAQGRALHSLASVEWLGADDQVLARSDAQAARSLSCARVPAPRAARRCALGFRARAAGQRSLRPHRRACAIGRSSTTACR